MSVIVTSALPASRMACARTSTLPFGMNTWAWQPNTPAAQETPLPWLPSVVVAKCMPRMASLQGGLRRSSRVVSFGSRASASHSMRNMA